MKAIHEALIFTPICIAFLIRGLDMMGFLFIVMCFMLVLSRVDEIIPKRVEGT